MLARRSRPNISVARFGQVYDRDQYLVAFGMLFGVGRNVLEGQYLPYRLATPQLPLLGFFPAR